MTIICTKKFLLELVTIRKDVFKKTLEEAQILTTQPQTRKWGKIKNSNVFYIRIKNDHRLFFDYINSKLRLLKLSYRGDEPYKSQEIKAIQKQIKQDSKNDFEVEEVDLSELFGSNVDPKIFSQTNNFIFNSEILSSLKIPEKYWEELTTLEDENHILDLNLPEEYRSLLVEYLTTPQTLEELYAQDQYCSDIDSLEELSQGDLDINDFLTTHLYLDQKQEEYCSLNIDKKENKCVLIKGSAGTGKTLLAFHRVKKIIERNPQGKILFATYSDTLAEYTKRILTIILGCKLSDKIVEINTPDQIALKIYTEKNGHTDPAEKSFQEDMLNRALVALNGNNIIDKRTTERLDELGIKYILDEFIKVIEAREIKDLRTYKKISRIGQKFRLGAKQRKAIWDIYIKWKQIITEDHKRQIQEWINAEALNIVRDRKSKIYDYVIVDEVQDLSPVSLKMLIEISKSYSGIYLTADTSQSLYQKLFSFKYVKKSNFFDNFGSIEKTLRKNYRNTKFISKACISILPEALEDKFIDPESLLISSKRLEGNKPTLILTDEQAIIFQTIQNFIVEFENKFKISRYEGAILSNDYHDNINEFVKSLNTNGIISEHITSESINNRDINLNQKAIRVMNIYAAKGLEFPYICLVDFSKNKLPRLTPRNASNVEKAEFNFQQRRLLYVACTRATKSLLIIGSRTDRTEFISLLDNRYWTIKEI